MDKPGCFFVLGNKHITGKDYTYVINKLRIYIYAYNQIGKYICVCVYKHVKNKGQAFERQQGEKFPSYGIE